MPNASTTFFDELTLKRDFSQQTRAHDTQLASTHGFTTRKRDAGWIIFVYNGATSWRTHQPHTSLSVISQPAVSTMNMCEDVSWVSSTPARSLQQQRRRNEARSTTPCPRRAAKEGVPDAQWPRAQDSILMLSGPLGPPGAIPAAAGVCRKNNHQITFIQERQKFYRYYLKLPMIEITAKANEESVHKRSTIFGRHVLSFKS